jgi:hypothetical protein
MDLALSSHADQSLLTVCLALVALGIAGLLAARRWPWMCWISLGLIVVFLASSLPQYLPSPSRPPDSAVLVSRMLRTLLGAGAIACALALSGLWRRRSRPGQQHAGDSWRR